jgi:hypothetical protein
MAKNHKKFHGIHITPKAGTHYEVRHEPVHESEGKGEMAMPAMGGDDQKNEKLFAHGERADLHKHLDNLMDAHEGKGEGEPDGGDKDDTPLPPGHPMNKLRRKM